MGNVMTAITEFVEFCRLLSQPENHIYTASGQYVQRQHNTRTFADMEGEMAWKLANLPRHTAYAKITKEQGERQIVLKRKIQTLKLPSPPAGMDERRRAIINRSYLLYYRERRQIEEEIRQKEKRRLAARLEAPAPSETRKKKRSARASAGRHPREGIGQRAGLSETDAPPASFSDQENF